MNNRSKIKLTIRAVDEVTRPSPRLSELESAGLTRDSGIKRPNPRNDETAIVWEAVSNPKVISQKPPGTAEATRLRREMNQKLNSMTPNNQVALMKRVFELI